MLAVIDDFPYLLARSPELASVIQRHLDSARDSGGSVRLVLCGSALSVMARLLVGTQALRGRASHDVLFGTFDFRTAAQFWGVDDARVAFQVHAVVGGTPGYCDLLSGRPPARMSEIPRRLERGVLNRLYMGS